MALALVAFITMFLFTLSLGILLFGRIKTVRRLAQVASFPNSPSSPVDAAILRATALAPGSRIERLLKPFHNVLPRNPQDVSSVQRRLVRAGYRENSYVNILYSSRVVAPLFLCILATATGMYRVAPLFIYAMAGGLGFLAPDYWLSSRIAARQRKLRLGLPEALDLIVICVEAGLTMDKATLRTSEEMRISQPAIADELSLVCLEQRAGCPRADAWRHLAERTDVETIRSLASILIQAEKFGSSVGKTLRGHAETLRTRRRQEVEEQAAKTTVKLVFPLVLLIFPSVFVVTLGPSMIVMFEAVAQYLS